jgi:hypothetical protein
MLDFIKTITDDAFGKCLLAFIVICIVSLCLLINYSSEQQAEEQKAWDNFSILHKCKKVGHIKGKVEVGDGIGVTANGAVGAVLTTTVSPDKNGWLCNDGVTYWR